MNKLVPLRLTFPIGILIAGCLLSAASPAAASRAHLPMGHYVRQATLIALADTAPGGDDKRDIVLTWREIIKGDAAQLGRQFVLSGNSFNTASVRVPREAAGIAVLLGGDGAATAPRVLEIYQKPREIEILRALVKIYQLPTERAQLTTLRDLALRDADEPSLLRVQLWADLRAMREAANFPIITDLFPDGDEAQQRAVVDLIGHIGDARGVPTLLAAMQSPQRSVALAAAQALTFYFPDSPRIIAAFRRALQSEMLKSTATYYLMRHDPEIRAAALAARTDYQKVSKLLEKGDETAARPYFLRILQDPKQTEAIVWFNPDWVARSIAAQPAEAEQIRHALLPVLEKFTTGDNYLQADAAAQVLGALHHADAVAPLLGLLEKKNASLFDKSTRIAAWALFDLGDAARAAAIGKLSARSDWAILSPVFEAAAQPDAGQALLDLLRLLKAEPNHNKAIAARWAIQRLGDLREQRAVTPLIEALSQPGWDAATLTEALIHIGGALVERAAEPLLSSDRHEIREAAMQILFALQGKRFLPLLRRIMVEPDFGVRSSAALYLGRIGTPDDLDLLLPLADFWKGDRNNHYWMMQAVSGIRDRVVSQFEIKPTIMSHEKGQSNHNGDIVSRRLNRHWWILFVLAGLVLFGMRYAAQE